MNFTRLKSPDFQAAASLGCFVYCYLRHKDSATAAAGTPYYIGIASRAIRPLEWHRAPVPTDKVFVRILRTGLDWSEACEWESFYIKRYGRKDIGTGILLNRTDGGEGMKGFCLSEESRAKISASLKGREITPEHRARLYAANQNRTFSDEHRAKLSAAATGRIKGPEELAKMSAARKGFVFNAKTRAKMSASATGRTKGVEERLKISVTRTTQTAEKYGITVELLASMTRQQRNNLSRRFAAGKRGAELFKGLIDLQPLAS